MKTGKLVSIVLTLAMLLSVLPMSAMAYGGTSEDKTAEVSVTIDNDKKLNLTTTKYNAASLTLKTSSFTIQNATGNIVVKADRWSLSGTDDEGDLLHYTQSYNGNGSMVNLEQAFFNLSLAFSNEDSYAVNVKIVDDDHGTVPGPASYTLTGGTSDGLLTVNATPSDGSDNAAAAQSVWEYLSNEDENSDYPTNIAITENDNDSKAILAYGSKIRFGNESLTVDKSDKLTIDQLDTLTNLQNQFRTNVRYNGSESDTAGVEILLKAGSLLDVGTRMIQLKRDLTITMSCDDDNDGFNNSFGTNELDKTKGTVLSSLYNAIVEGTPSGSDIAIKLANAVDKIFGAIQALDGEDDAMDLTFTFSDAETSSKEVLTGTTEGTTITTTGGDDITLGDSTSGGQTFDIESGSTVKVGTTTTTETTDNTTDTTTTTKVDEYIVETTENETSTTKYVYEITETTTKTTSGNETDTTITKTAITTTVDTETVKNTADETASKTPSDYVNVAKVLTAAVKDKNSSVNNVKSIAEMEIKLETKQKTEGTPNTALAEAIADVGSNGKVFEVKPIATVTPAGGTPFTHEVSNAELAGTNASFTFTIQDEAWAGKTVSVKHYYDAYTDANGKMQEKGSAALKSGTDYTFDSETGTITLTLNHFSSLAITATSSFTPVLFDGTKSSVNSVFNAYMNLQEGLYYTYILYVGDTSTTTAVLTNGNDEYTITLSEVSTYDSTTYNTSMKQSILSSGYSCVRLTSTSKYYYFAVANYPNRMTNHVTIKLKNSNDEVLTLYQNTGSTTGTINDTTLYSVENNVYDTTMVAYLQQVVSNSTEPSQVNQLNLANTLLDYYTHSYTLYH